MFVRVMYCVQFVDLRDISSKKGIDVNKLEFGMLFTSFRRCHILTRFSQCKIFSSRKYLGIFNRHPYWHRTDWQFYWLLQTFFRCI